MTFEEIIRDEVQSNRLPRQWTSSDLKQNENIRRMFSETTIPTDPANRSIHHPTRPDLGNGVYHNYAFCYRVNRQLGGHQPLVYELIHH